MSRTVQELLDDVTDEQAVTDLQTYFGGSENSNWFAGSRFESLSGGGDRTEVANRVVADDLVALTMLSVNVPPYVALELLEGEDGRKLADLLTDIPTDLDLGDPGAGDALEEGSAAWRAYELLLRRGTRRFPGIGPVTASKLLARKRPRLVPVCDRVVWGAIGKPTSVWNYFNTAFQGERLTQALDEVRHAAGVPAQVKRPRVLDVVLWMRYRGV